MTKPIREFDPQKLAYGHTVHEYTLNPLMVQSLERYVNYGIPTGSFLRAALENDFIGAVGKADSDNQRNLFALADFIYNYIPSACHGSPEKVDGWLASFKRVEE